MSRPDANRVKTASFSTAAVREKPLQHCKLVYHTCPVLCKSKDSLYEAGETRADECDSRDMYYALEERQDPVTNCLKSQTVSWALLLLSPLCTLKTVPIFAFRGRRLTNTPE